jgi:hypothetical protein
MASTIDFVIATLPSMRVVSSRALQSLAFLGAGPNRFRNLNPGIAYLHEARPDFDISRCYLN